MIRTLAGTLLIAGVLMPFGGAAHRRTEEGNRHYEEERYEDALRAYTEAQVSRPDAPELFYDIGNVLYRQGDFAGAEESYTRSLHTAHDELAPSAAFNLGNALFRQENWPEAVKAYRRALEADPGDIDAKRNLELALRALREQQQQKQDQKQDDRDGEDEQDQQQQQQQDGDEEGERDPSPSSEQQEKQGQDEERQQPQPQPGKMSKEEAERLLNSVAEQEKENLREAAMLRRQSSGTKREEDW